jgi:hypothetical protein
MGTSLRCGPLHSVENEVLITTLLRKIVDHFLVRAIPSDRGLVYPTAYNTKFADPAIYDSR